MGKYFNNENIKVMNNSERLKANKQPMNLWEHVRNHQFKVEMRKEMEEAAERTPQTPDSVQEHIQWLK